MDGTGQVIDLMSRPHISGPLMQLLPQTQLFFNLVFSALILRERFTFWQLWSVMVLLGGVAMTLMPSLEGGLESVNFFIIPASLFSCPNSISFVLKDLLFRQKRDLDVFVVNSHTGLFQLILQPVFVPLTFLINPQQLRGQQIGTYLLGALHCFTGTTPEWHESLKCHSNPWPYLIYIVFNITLNVTVLALVKEVSVVVTFLVLAMVLPLSVMGFYLDWPLLQAATFSPWHVAGLIVILSALVLYRGATYVHKRYALSCCSPRLPCWERITYKRVPQEIN